MCGHNALVHTLSTPEIGCEVNSTGEHLLPIYSMCSYSKAPQWTNDIFFQLNQSVSFIFKLNYSSGPTVHTPEKKIVKISIFNVIS